MVGGSTRSAPYRKVVHHHASALRFYCRRYARDPRLVMAPVVAAFLVLRGLASLARAAVAQRREAGVQRPLAGPGPDELGRPRRSRHPPPTPPAAAPGRGVPRPA